MNHMPVIANPADPSHCNFGRDGVELYTQGGIERVRKQRGSLATLASQLENEGTRQGKEARARYRSSQSADPCGNLRFPLSRPPWDQEHSRGMGLRAVVHADICSPPAHCGCRAACCSCGPAPRIRAVGHGKGPRERPVQHFPRAKAPTRVSVRVIFFFSTKRCAVCGGRVMSCVLCSHWRECGNQTLSGLHSSCFVPRPGYDKGDAPIWPAEFSWAHLCSLTVESRLAAALSSVSRTEELDRTGQALCESTRAGQRKLSLSSRDDPNYKDIMRLRAQLADTLL